MGLLDSSLSSKDQKNAENESPVRRKELRHNFLEWGRIHIAECRQILEKFNIVQIIRPSQKCDDFNHVMSLTLVGADLRAAENMGRG